VYIYYTSPKLSPTACHKFWILDRLGLVHSLDFKKNQEEGKTAVILLICGIGQGHFYPE